MQKQILEYIDKHLSPHLCGYRKGYSTQTALISILEKLKLSIDNEGFVSGLLMDLSKAFDTINHQLLLPKLHAYGFSQQALAIICSYLSNRKQRIKINNVFSSWKDLILGVPQGSVLGPLLFNIYLNDLFFFLKDVGICNFADDTTTYISDESLENVLKSLEKNSMLAIRWFENNYMKLNTDKCRLIVSGYKHEQVWANIGKDLIWESNDVKLLGVTIDRDLKFDKHVLKLCSKANQKLSALSRMANLLSFNKRRTLFKAFVESQFKYCPIVWMFHSRRTNNKINRLHERALRIVYDDDVSTFDQLLAMDKSFCIHHQNIQRLLIEIYKALHDTSGNSLKELFVKRESTISLLSKPEFVIYSVNSILKGKNSLRYFGSVIWSLLPIENSEDHSISSFITKIKQWKPIACPCTICRSYVGRVGYIKVSDN